MANKSASAPPDPDKLVRQQDGSYRSGDARFAVEQSNGSWFVADQEMADDFGQPRVVGPIATLKLAKDAIPRLRDGPIPMRKPMKQTRRIAPKADAARPQPKTWLDRLPADRRRAAVRLVRALEREGVPDAPDVARAQVERGEGADPRPLARRLLDARLERVLDEVDDDDDVRQVVRRAMRVVSVEGSSTGRDLPGWAIVAVEPDGTITDRRIELD